jgi:formylglycine-generating enzyme required for sulfatase activity
MPWIRTVLRSHRHRICDDDVRDLADALFLLLRIRESRADGPQAAGGPPQHLGNDSQDAQPGPAPAADAAPGQAGSRQTHHAPESAIDSRPIGVRLDGAGWPQDDPPRPPEQLPESGKEPLWRPPTTGRAGPTLLLPGAPPLPDDLEIRRALRPFRRLVGSRVQHALDEVRTADNFAETGRWIPAFRDATERWLEVALVVERSESMKVWQPTIDHFARILAGQGAFRDVRRWELTTVAQRAAPPRPVLRKRGAAAERKPRELLHPTGRCLLIVVSDFVSGAWDACAYHGWLGMWARQQPVALLHLLPERYLDRGGLCRHAFVPVRAPRPGSPNSRYCLPEDPFAVEAEPEPEAVLRTDADSAPPTPMGFPLFTLEPESIKRLARFVSSAGAATCPAVVLDTAAEPQDLPDPQRARAPGNLTAEDLKKEPGKIVEAFDYIASERAQRLARLLSLFPLVRPVMLLVQQALLPESTASDLAEVLSSQLVDVEPIPPAARSEPTELQDFIDADDVLYRFRDGVIEELQKPWLTPEFFGFRRRVNEEINDYLRRRPATANPFRGCFLEQAGDREKAQSQVDGINGGLAQWIAELDIDLVRRFGGKAARSIAEIKIPANWGGVRSTTHVAASAVAGNRVAAPLGRDSPSTATTGAPGRIVLASPEAVGRREANREETVEQSGTASRASTPRFPPSLFADPLRTGPFLGPPLIRLPGGPFTMGSDSPETPDAAPPHPVTVGAFALGEYPITFSDFDAFCAATGRVLPLPHRALRGRANPVVAVDAEAAEAFCRWLSELTGQHYRLPTEAEWEYACRAGSTTRFAFGDAEAELPAYALFGGRRAGDDVRAGPVTGRRPNAWGLHDLHGCVWEWTADRFAPYPGAAGSAVAARVGPDAAVERVVRGGCWQSDPIQCSSAWRERRPERIEDETLGFRVARDVADAAPAGLPADAAIRVNLREPITDGLLTGPMAWLPGGIESLARDAAADAPDPEHDRLLQSLGIERLAPTTAPAPAIGAFAIGQHPVTCDEYAAFCRDEGYRPPPGFESGSRPVVNVSWADANHYCWWVSRRTGAVWRLPSEAEWELACRAGSTDARWYFADDATGSEEGLADAIRQHIYCAESAGHAALPRPVHDASAGNAYGLYDMLGNVWEWIAQDAFDPRYPPGFFDPRNAKGGSCRSEAAKCTVGERLPLGAGEARPDLGFRVVRDGRWPLAALPDSRALVPEATRTVAPAILSAPDQPRLPGLVAIPAGYFTMGDAVGTGNRWERPTREVRLSAFAMSQHPVTLEQYLAFVEATGTGLPIWLQPGSPCHVQDGRDGTYRRCGMTLQGSRLPVVGVAIEDAEGYCAWLSAETGRCYRLPSEAQWEYACRARSGEDYCFGRDVRDLPSYGWFDANAGDGPRPVGSRQPNAFGLYDVHGNVAEWTRDRFGFYAPTALPLTDPEGPSAGTLFAIRGGSWRSPAVDCRSASRSGRTSGPEGCAEWLGFRVVCET